MQRDQATGMQLVGQTDSRPIKIKIAITDNGLAIVDALTMRPISGIKRISMNAVPGALTLDLELNPAKVALIVESEAQVFQPPVHCIMENGEAYAPRDGESMVLIKDEAIIGKLTFEAADHGKADDTAGAGA